nr:serine/threonine-protein phosphatase 4 regulatory subunit 2 [Ipomoea batatas]GMC88538.1 serine/threonine-protein phosphatase 4 regulatory subunit 2 [Ipomoea batatas]
MANQQEISIEERMRLLEAIAATGKFWHDWDKLKSILSFHLKQVLEDYPEAKMTNELQISSLGEPFPDLAKRLDDALISFVDGPPFTLQRLCEILLDARNIYSKLSKLALALEKNLLVTSTLTISADPSTMMLKATEADTEAEGSQQPSNSVPNGITPTSQDPDEIMGEVEGAEVVDDGMSIDMETLEEMVRSETNSTIAEPPGDS